jgi:predicted glycosyltransferase
MVHILKIWIDILTPKQVNFLGALHAILRSRGHTLVLTTRKYAEANQLLALRRLKAKIFGSYGGGSIKDKLRESAHRIIALSKFVETVNPDLAISFSSPEAARVSFGLSIPHFCISDSPHAEAVCRLTIPLSRRLFAPAFIPRKDWMRYGIPSSAIIQYRGLDPVAWLRAFKPDRKKIEKLGVDGTRPLVTIRLPEEQSSYLRNAKRPALQVAYSVARRLGRMKRFQVVVLPRYEAQRKTANRLDPEVIVPREAIDGTNLLFHSSAFLGAGGTMTCEAALLGVPSISCYPSSPTYVDRYLMRCGLLERILEPAAIVRRIRLFLMDESYRMRAKVKAQRVMQKMEDPVCVVASKLELR